MKHRGITLCRINDTGPQLMLGQRKVCLQWISLYMGVLGNEAAVELAGRGCDLPNPSSSALSCSEIHSLHIVKVNLTWRNPPAHYRLHGHFSGIVVWRSRFGSWHSYAEKSNELGVGFPAPRGFETTNRTFPSRFPTVP
ncbi:hypothetical protein TNCV_2601191 [Trichonephila clavipes]|nr:hypothetical protein TNCV_2601191 [Trichonephila clavipes]